MRIHTNIDNNSQYMRQMCIRVREGDVPVLDQAIQQINK